jgi:drug/metabolite transporter (DMT)-like permease
VVDSLQPLLTYVIAVILGWEQKSLPRLLSTLLCVGGLALVVLADCGVGSFFWIGLLVVCLSPLILALNVLISKDLVTREAPLVVITVNLLIGTACLLPFMGGSVLAKVGDLATTHWVALAFCVLPGTVFAYAIWYSALRFLSPSSLSLWYFVVPIIALVAGYALFGESLTALKCVGVAIMMFGLYLVTVKFKQNQRR